MGTEKMLCVERDGEPLHAIRCREIPRRSLMTPMFTLHEIPTVVGVSPECPPAEVGIHAGTSIERRVGVSVSVPVVEETIDASIDV